MKQFLPFFGKDGKLSFLKNLYYNKLHFYIIIAFLCVNISVNGFNKTIKSKNNTNASAEFVDYVVMNVNDAGVGSLRQAMLDAIAAGAGPHNITFDASLSGQTINITSELPIISVDGININGDIDNDGTGDITIDAGSGDIARYIFRGNATGTNTTIKGFTLQDTGSNVLHFEGNVTGITIEDIIIQKNDGNFIDHGIIFLNNATDIIIRNVTVTNIQSGGAGLYFVGTGNNVLVDNLDLSNTGGGSAGGIRVNGAVNTFTIQNCDLNLNLVANSDDGDFGILFSNTTDNVTLTNTTISTVDGDPLSFIGTANNININNLSYVNGDGTGNGAGIRFQAAVTNVTMNTVNIAMDHVGGTNNGDFGIFFGATATTVNIDGFIASDADAYSLFITGIATDISIIDSSSTNTNGSTTQEAYRFNSTINGLIMTDVTISSDLDGNPDDGTYGIYFNGPVNADPTKSATLTRISAHGADQENIRTISTVTNFTMEDCTITNIQDGISNEFGVGFYGNVARTNVVVNNSTFDGNGAAGIILSGIGVTNQITISNNIFRNSSDANFGYGIWMQADGITEYVISGNTITNNSSNGIYNEGPDGVNYTQNSIYNNGISGIRNTSGGNDGLQNLDGDLVWFTSSTSVGSGNYEVQFTLPSFCTDCDVEFYTNNMGDTPFEGRTYAGTVTGLAGGKHTATISAGGNTIGFWTATFKDNTLNGSVSEYGNSFAVTPVGPANVGNGNMLWIKADAGVTDAGTSVTSWLDQSPRAFGEIANTIIGDPDLQDNQYNFNPVVNFDGNDYFRLGDQGILQSPETTEGEVFIVLNTTVAANAIGGYPLQFGGASGGGNGIYYYDWVDANIYDGFGTSARQGFEPGAASTGNQPVDIRNVNIYNILSSPSEWTASFNGATNFTNNTNTVVFNTASDNNTYVGTSNSSTMTGNIAEIILYDRALTATERNKINSYLAVKYGISLDQTAATNYVNSSGTTTWSATTAGVYNKDIVAIGRDTEATLDQQISKSINSEAILTISTDANLIAANGTHTSLTDGQFLFFSNDGGATTIQTTEVNTVAYNTRITREWQVQNIGTVGAVNVKFEGFGGYDVLSDTDGDFSTIGDQIILGTLDINGELTGVTFTSGAYITLAQLTPSPGGVIGSLEFWLKANGDVTVSGGSPTDWNDETGKHVGEVVAGGGAAMTYADNGHNFNPYVTFNGNGLTNGQYFAYASQVFLNGVTSAEVFSVLEAGVGHTIDGGFPYEFAGNAGGSTQEYDYLDGRIYDTFGATFPGASHHWDPFSPPVGSSVEIQNPHIYNTYSATNDWAASFDGELNFSSNTNTTNFATTLTGSTVIGAANNSVFNGNVSEIILHNNKLTDQERQRVNSYLSLKYGITLNQTSATAYLASDGATKMWDETLNTSYNNDIFGIGRDDLSALDQRISKSINTDAIFTVSLDNNFTVANNDAGRTAVFANDLQFLSFANDGGVTTAQTTELNTAAYDTRIVREWQVQNVGGVGPVNVKFEGFGGYDVLSDTDGDFSTTGDQTVVGTLDAKGELTGITFTHGAYLTLARVTPFPGGVATDISLWLRADAGISQTDGQAIDTWSDQSGNGNNATQGTVASQPIVNSNTINFNSGLNFQNDFMLSTTPSVLGVQNSDYEIFAIYKSNTVQSGNVNSDIQFITSTNDTNFENFEMLVNNGTFGDHGLVFLPNTSKIIGQGVNGDYTNQNPYLFFAGIDADVGNTGVNGLNAPKVTLSGVRSSNNAALRIGSRGSTGEFPLNGVLSELIVYSSSNTTMQRNQIQSYLSIKYGITLDQSTATNYVNSAGTVVWNTTTAGTYNNDIFGIGRDLGTALDQQISKSVNAGTILTVSTDTNFTNANGEHTSLENEQFLFFANDGGVTTEQATEINATVYNTRITREWQVQNIGNVGAVNVKFEGFEGYDVLSDTDGDFSTTGDQTVLGTLDENGELTGVTFTNEAYLTLAKLNPFPGGVEADLNLWLKADTGLGNLADGAGISNWLDQSSNGYEAIQPSGAHQPTFKTLQDDFNFNASVQFNNTTGDPTNSSVKGFGFAAQPAGATAPPSGNQSFTIFQVTSKNSSIFTMRLGSAATVNNSVNSFIGGSSLILGGPFNLTPEATVMADVSNIGRLTYDSGTSIQRAVANGDTSNAAEETQVLNITTTVNAMGVDHNGYGGIGSENGVGEVIMYIGIPTNTEIQQIESYLALKYGITLNQTVATSYVASDGTTIWDATTAGAFNKDIFGIVRDDLSSLNQQISKSANTGTIVTISTDTNFSGANGTHTSLTNKQFLILANDGGAITSQTSELPTGFAERTVREWKITNIGSVGAVNLKFDGFDDTWALVNDTDDDFSNGGTTNLGTLSATGEITGIALTNNTFLTLVKLPDTQVIQDYADDNTNPIPTIADYTNAGVTGVTAGNLAEINAVVDGLTGADVDTTAEIQAIVDGVVAGNVIENYADDNTNPAPTITDYTDTGVTGVTAGNLAEINAVIDGLTGVDVDSLSEIQAIVDGVVAGNVIENYADDNTNPAPTVTDYTNAGVTGVTAGNLAEINAVVDGLTGADVDSLAEIQAIIDGVIAGNVIENYADDNTNPAPTVMDYTDAGVTGVTAGNLAEINAVVDDLTGTDVDSLSEIQAIIDGVIAGNVIENYADDNTNPTPTVTDYTDAGVTGVTAGNLAEINAVVDGLTGTDVDSLSEIQAIIDEVIAGNVIENYADNNTNPAPTVTDYTSAGVTGVTAGNLAEINAVVDGLTGADVDSLAEIQAIVDGVVAGNVIENYADDNTNPAPTVTDYTDAGVAGVTAGNLAEINAVVDDLTGTDVDSLSEIQAIIDGVIAGNVIENYADDNTNPVPTVTDYTDSGVTGVTAGNLAEVNAVVDGLTGTDVDSLSEIQAIIDGVIAGNVIENYADDNTNPAPTVTDYTDAGVTGVTTGNLAEINAVVDGLTGTDVDSLSEIQAIIDGVIAGNVIENYADDNTNPAPTVTDYTDSGVTGVTTGNLAEINAVVDGLTGTDVDSLSEIQAIIDGVVSGNVIEAYADDNTNPIPTVADYTNAGLTGVNLGILAEVNAAVDSLTATDVDTIEEIQAIIDGVVAGNVIEVYADDNTNPTPTVADYTNAGVTGVTLGNLALVNATVDTLIGTDVDTLLEIQAIVDAIVASVTWTGTTNNSWTESTNWAGGTVPSSTDDVIISGGATPVIDGTGVTLNDITIEAGSSLTIRNGGSLIVTGTSSGTVTYERSFTSNWHLIASPVLGETIEGVIANNNLDNGTAGNLGLAPYENSGANPWSYYNAGTTGAMMSGKGYSMKLSSAGTAQFSGTVNSTTTNYGIVMGTRNNFNLIGNPFASYVTSSTFTTNNTALLSEETIWLWDGTQYITKNNLDPIEIAPTQGFFVEASTAGNISFNNANQGHNADTFLRSSLTKVELLIENDEAKSSTKIYYVTNKTTGFDNGCDSKMFGGVTYDFAVYTELVANNDGSKLAIQALPDTDMETIVVPIGIIGTEGKEITFTANESNLPENVHTYLEDRVNGRFINLSEESYKITLTSPSNGIGQFYLHTTSKRLSSEDIASNSENVSIYKSSDDEITISGVTTDAKVYMYSLLGTEITRKEITPQGVNKMVLPELPTGIYIIKLQSRLTKISKKIVID